MYGTLVARWLGQGVGMRVGTMAWHTCGLQAYADDLVVSNEDPNSVNGPLVVLFSWAARATNRFLTNTKVVLAPKGRRDGLCHAT